VKAKSGLTFCIALLALVGYWWFVRPPGLSRIGYSQNLAETELTRQIVADDLANHDGFRFFTTRVMAPDGINAAYFPWSLERDWLGGWFWIWNRNFPFRWVYFGASLLISYRSSASIINVSMSLSRRISLESVCTVLTTVPISTCSPGLADERGRLFFLFHDGPAMYRHALPALSRS